MKTIYQKIDRLKPDPQIIEAAATMIRQGGLVAFPTETVYGLGANGLDPLAVERIFLAKGRPADNPLILHIAERQELSGLVSEIPDWLKPVLDIYWPGPLTVVLRRNRHIPDQVTAGLDSVAVRLPASTVARALIRAAGVPVAAPSANLSGRPSPTTAEAVMEDLFDRVDIVLDGGVCDVGLESTVLDCTTDCPTILRPGGVTLEMLQDLLGSVRHADAKDAETQTAPRSPGMKYRHYAPQAPLMLFQPDQIEGEAGLLAVVRQNLRGGKTVGALVSSEVLPLLPPQVRAFVHGSRQNPAEAAATLYRGLRWFDRQSVDLIVAEGVPETGIGRALMNRLAKAAVSGGINGSKSEE